MSEQKNVEAIYPLAPAQRGMLYYCALHPEETATYFEQWRGTYGGALDPASLRRAWELVVARHPVLRTQFLWERRERPLQVVRSQVEVPWREEDWRTVPGVERERRLAAYLDEDRREGFRLDRAPLTRLALFRLTDNRWRLVWSFHHLVLDGWSIAVVLREVHAAYAALAEGREPALPAVRPYKDFIAWLGRRDEEGDREFWTREMSGLERPFRTPWPPAAGPEGSAQEGSAPKRHGEHRLTLTGGPARELAEAARAHGLTVNALAQGAFALLLRRYSGADRVTYGTVSSGRPPELAGVEAIAGVFMNALPFRVDVDEAAAVGEWLRGVQLRQVEAREHAHCALEDVQRWAGLPVGEALFDALLIFENYPAMVASDGSGGLELLDNGLDEEGVFPCSLYVSPRGGRIDLAVAFDRQRFDGAGMERVLQHYVRLLRGLAGALADGGERKLAEIPMLADGEGTVLAGAARDEAELRPVHEQVADRAREAPEAVAVATREGALSYAALAARAEALARTLRRAGAGPGAVVALALRRSPEVPLAMLAVLEAGAAYLPVDPDYPAERIELILADAGVELVVTSAATLAEKGHLPLGHRTVVVADAAEPSGRAAGLESEGAAEGPLPAVDPRQAVYVIYTSGSTGTPKGVVVEHRNLSCYVETAAREQELRPGTRVLQLASISFDTSAEEIWPCLTRGGTLVLRDEEAAGSAHGFSRHVEEQRVEVVDLPTAFWHELASQYAAGDASLPGGSLRLVIIGGERALGERLADWRRAVAAAGLEGRLRLLNTYGPTETTIVTASIPVDQQGAGSSAGLPADPPIGRPVPGSRIALVDAGGHPVPPGVSGEAWVGGAQVTRGYLDRPGATAERFVPDPFSGIPGARVYRTGDLCAEVPLPGASGDGAPERGLAFRGRIDGQVKVRGFRVEPGEIESALVAHPAVGEAAVVARRMGPDGERDLRLVAYVAGRSGEGGKEPPTEAELRRFLSGRLPEFMVPAHFVALEALPKTTSGKLDRNALPRPDELRPDGASPFVASRTPTEELLVGLWSELLGLERIGVHDDLFALGGHSLLVGRLAAKLRSVLGVELPLIEIFEHPTVAELAGVVESAEGAPRDGVAPELPPLAPTDRSGPLPLSYQQERVWFLQQLVPGSIAYNFQMRLFLRGELDVAALERALSEIVRRHEVLRTTFPESEGRPVQVVQEPWPVKLPVTDLSDLATAAAGADRLERAERRAEEILAEEVSKPFELTALPLIRWRLLRLDESHHQLIQVEHHFVHDGWSVALLLKELKTLYEAFAADQPSPLPELPAQYGDFAVWQRGWMEGEAMDRLLGYWTRELEGAPTRLDLPFDRQRPRRSTMKGDAIRELLPPEIYRRLRAFGRREGFTLFMTMSAAFQALLARYTGRQDFLVGTGIANRRVAEVEPIIGMMVNSLVLRADASGDPTFRELLVRVRRSLLGAHAHQDMPFERLVEELQPTRDPSVNPLFQVMFSFHDAAVPDLSFGGLEAGFLVEHNRSAKTDLNVIVAPRAEQRVGRESSEADERAMVTWEFSTDLFDRSTIERLIDHFLTLVDAALADPERKVSELPLMAAAEEELVLREWSGTATGYPRDASLAELFAACVAAAPEAPALAFEDRRLSYRELAERSARIAHRLRDLGVRRGTPVAVALERGLDLVPTILGILQAGGFYVPLDAAYPRERLAFMMADVAAPVLVTRTVLLERLPGDPGERDGALTVLCLDRSEELEALEAAPATAPELPPNERPCGEDPAYVVYTSGSTGRPKGVTVPQRAVARLVLEADFAHFGPGETFLQLAPVSFDAATLEIWGPLLTGGRLVVYPNERPSLERLGRILAEEAVTTLWLTAGLFHQMVEGNVEGLAPVRQLLAGGDVLSPAHCRRVLEAHPELTLVNGYGPTENTTFTCCHAMAGADEVGDPVSVGRPIADTRVFVVDARLRAVPIGVPGELVAGGDGLASGYWGRPALTAERFVPSPFAGAKGARVYRTGDLVRWRPEGVLEFLGRFDSQVKLRGFRIETGEIERALVTHPAVAEALVMVRGTGEDKVLVGYLVGDPAEQGDNRAGADALRAYLAPRLPDYMVPSAFVFLQAFPLDPNGKVDRGALPEPSFEVAEECYVAPRSDLERTLVELWTELLPVERVGVRDDFFDLGGHSLAATRIAARVRRDLGVDVPLTVLFEEPTVERLARRLEEGDRRATDSSDAPGEATQTRTSLDAVAAAEDLSDEELDALLGRMIGAEKG